MNDDRFPRPLSCACTAVPLCFLPSSKPNAPTRPLVGELLELAIGVSAYDVLSRSLFAPCLRHHRLWRHSRTRETRRLRAAVPLQSSRANRCCRVLSRELTVYGADQSSGVRAHGNTARGACKDVWHQRVPLLHVLGSLRFPQSFPYDLMHLIWESLNSNLVLFWSDHYKGIDDGQPCVLSLSVWQAVGTTSAAAARTSTAADCSSFTSWTWSVWSLFVTPPSFEVAFSKFAVFCSLVRILN